MAEAKRTALKKVDAAKMAAGVYFAVFTNGTEFSADLRDLPVAFEGEGEARKVSQTLGAGYDGLGELVQRTMQYGIKQKLDDSMAGAESVEEAIEEVQSTWAAIKAGNWTTRVPGEGVEGGLFARAYAAINELTLPEAKAKISAMIEKNLAKAQAKEAAKPEGERKEVSERQVFNAIRDVAFERVEGLKAKYDEIKEKRGKKSNPATRIEVDLE
jgi:hypothetical protein